MSTSIIRNNLPYSTRERRHEIGKQGEINVGKLLAEYFGHRKVSYAFDGYSEGTNHYPDLVLRLNPPLAIEVKSINPYKERTIKTGKIKGVNYVGINRYQWFEVYKFARNRLANYVLIVEVRLKEKGIYFWFEPETIEEYMNILKGEYIHISLWDVLMKGNSLIYPDEIKYLEYWNTHHSPDNEIQEKFI